MYNSFEQYLEKRLEHEQQKLIDDEHSGYSSAPRRQIVSLLQEILSEYRVKMS